MTDTLVEIRDLEVCYLTGGGPVVACEGIDLDVRRGEILGVVGESGCGKSTLLTALTRLERPPAVTSRGSITYRPADARSIELVRLDEDELRAIRWTEIAVVLQSAMNSFNPVARIGAQFRDVIRRHDPSISAQAAAERTAELLAMVGISGDRAAAFPHELSGGMRQRAAIALALACSAELLVCDEPTTAVDVVVQRQILSNVLSLREQLGFAVVFVTHDLSLLLEFADRIAVMYAGRLVEVATPAELYDAPLHPYTAGLRESFPSLSEPMRKMTGIPGAPPDLANLPGGCAFHPRCPKAFDPCPTDIPLPRLVEDRRVACHLFEEAL